MALIGASPGWRRLTPFDREAARILMASNFQLRQLISASFLHELHHFLWTDTRMVGDSVDAGWNCRDHAWIITFLLRAFGHESVVAHGKAFYASGPTGKRATISYSQQPHSWVMIRKLGAIDLSIKPEFISAGDVFQVPIDWVFLNKAGAKTRCDTLFFSEDAAYQNAVTHLPLRRNQAAVAYRTMEVELLDDGHFPFAAGWTRSSLCDRLGLRHGDPSLLYTALLMHLIEFIRGNARSLAALPFDDAWAVLAERRWSTAEPVSGFDAKALQTLAFSSPG